MRTAAPPALVSAPTREDTDDDECEEEDVTDSVGHEVVQRS